MTDESNSQEIHRLDRGIAAAFEAVRDTAPPLDMPNPDEQRGTRIGPYKLLQEIGEGGFGRVYMAEQLEPVRRKVALKIIKPGMDTRDVIARFEAERQALAMMDHPNIARVFDGGTTETGQPYFVMELVKGVPITEFCDKNNFETRKRLELFMTVCQAVQHAHQKGIIHRDLKPSNIMVTLNDGEPVPKVIDFGVAKAISQRLTEKTLFTQYGQMIGTPQYMSPEQAEMSELDIDTRSDIYSLGVLLYELLTGTTPLEADSLRSAGYVEMLRIIKDVEPAKPSTRLSTLGDNLTVICEHRKTDAKRLRQSIRGDLDWVVMKALDKQRDRRYETADGLAADLKRHLHNEPVVARPPSAVYKFQKAWRRNKVVFTASAAVMAAVTIGLFVSVFSLAEAARERDNAQTNGNKAQRALKVADEARRTAELSREDAANQAKALSRQVYLIHMANADQASLASDFLRTKRELEACPIGQRGWEWSFLKQRNAATISLELPGREKPAFTRDGKRIIALGSDPNANKARVWDTSSGKLLRDLEHKGTVIILALSTDERRLAVGERDGKVTLWNIEKLESVKQEWEVDHNKNRFDGMAFSPNGKLLATASMDRTLKILDTSDGAEKHSIEFNVPVRGASFSPDGRWLAAGFVNGLEPAILVNAATGKIENRIPHKGASVPVFSPNGEWLATGDQQGWITLWRCDGKELVEAQNWKAGPDLVVVLDFSADGSHLISAFQDKTVNIWELATGRKVASTSTVQTVYWLTAHPLDRDVVGLAIGAKGGIKFWESVYQDQSVTVATHKTAVRSIRFSSDGRWLAAGSHPRRIGEDEGIAGPVVVLEGQSGTQIQTIGSRIWGFDWIPNSQSMIVATADDDEDVLQEYDALSGKELWRLPGHAERLRPFVGPSGQKLFSVARDSTVRIWEIRSGKLEREFNCTPKKYWYRDEMGHLFDVAVSPMARRVAIAFAETSSISIWDTETQKETHSWGKPAFAFANLLFTKDEKRLHVGGEWGELVSYDTKGNRKSFSGHTGSITALALSPDEKQIVASDSDGRVVIWDVESTMPLVTLVNTHSNEANEKIVVTALDWSPDHERIVAGKSDGTVQIWTLPAIQK